MRADILESEHCTVLSQYEHRVFAAATGIKTARRPDAYLVEAAKTHHGSHLAAFFDSL
jgi:hypothetical protein